MKGKELIAVVGISGIVDKSMDKAIEAAKSRLSGINPTALKVGAGIAAIGTAAFTVGKELVQLGDEYNKAMNQLQSSTGATAEEMKGLGDIVKNVYGNNFGENIQDVADGVATVEKNTKLTGKALQDVTEGAFALRDVFDYDITESSRAAKAMMINFGIEGDKAMSMIAAGAQNGLDYSGELLDSISEYSVQFAKVGFSADDMFNIFQEGAESGAWNIDKMGDAIKEFSIRSIDGSKTTIAAFEDLGLNAEKTMQIFAKGGEGARKEFDIVIDKLMAMEDPVARDAAGVALFGTMWEDLGTDAMQALADMESGSYDTKNALDQIKNTRYDDLTSAMQGIGRTIEILVLPAASWLAKKLAEVAPYVIEMVNTAKPKLEEFAETIKPIAKVAVDLAVKGFGFLIKNAGILIPIIGGLTGALGAYKLAQFLTNAAVVAGTVAEGAAITTTTIWSGVSAIATGATTALGAAFTFMTGPIGLIILAIGAVIAIGIALYKNWDTVKAYAIIFAEKIKAVFEGIKNGIINAFQKVSDFLAKIFGGMIGIAKAPINGLIGLINKAIDGINSISVDIPDWVPLVGGSKLGFNIPKIPKLATGGFTEGVSIAGEAGTEAVLSFDPKYRSQNLAYWAKAGQMLGATEDDYMLGDNSQNNRGITLSGITFAPNITIQGNADKADIMAAIEAEYPEFIDMLERWLLGREEFDYG